MNRTKDEIAKDEIIENAQKLFRQFGLKKTTMDEIAASCGKAKSTLYHYYSSKEEVFQEVLTKEMKSLRRIVKEKVEKQSKLIDKLTTYFISFHEEIINKLNLNRVIKQEFIKSSISEQQFNKLIDFEKSYLKRILEDAYDAGDLRSISSNDFDWVAEIMIAAFFGIVRHIIERDEVFDNERLAKTTETIIPKIFT